MNVPNDTYVYRIDGPVTDTSILSPEMKELCADMLILNMKLDPHQDELRPRVLFQEPSGESV